MRRIKVLGFVGLVVATAPVVQAHTVTADTLNVRTGPGTGYAVVGTLRKGTVVNVTGTSGSWKKINSPKTGWVSGQYLADTPHTTTTTATSGGADLVWPSSGTISGRFYDTSRSTGRRHGAIDITHRLNSPIYASRGGYMGTMANNSGGYGYYIKINHTNGHQTVYAHLNKFNGGRRNVRQGDHIAYMGRTGAANGVYHIHWELQQWGVKKYVPATYGRWVNGRSPIPYNVPGL